MLKLPIVSVVVPVFNGARTIEDCITSIVQADYPPQLREIVIVDNASTDPTPRLVARFPVACVTELERGPAPARNRGICASSGDIVAFTDADCVVARDWLRELVAAFEDDDRVMAVAGECVAYPPTTPAQRYMMDRVPCMQRAALSAVRPYFATGNVAFRREAFARVGLFDPRFITGEDQDFAWRFLRAGLTFRYAARSVVFHQHRRNARELFMQQLGWGRGAVLLRRHHGVPWGVRAELAEYRKLLRALASLMLALGRCDWRGGERAGLYHAFYAVVREGARRIAGLST